MDYYINEHCLLLNARRSIISQIIPLYLSIIIAVWLTECAVNMTFSGDDAIVLKKSPSVESLCLEISVLDYHSFVALQPVNRRRHFSENRIVSTEQHVYHMYTMSPQ